jgi:hypothetical protein
VFCRATEIQSLGFLKRAASHGDLAQEVQTLARQQRIVDQLGLRQRLVGGYGFLGGQAGAALVRYTAAGALDQSFDGDGRLILASIPDGAVDIAVQPDGKILVAGRDFAVARLKPGGSDETSLDQSACLRYALIRVITQPGEIWR